MTAPLEGNGTRSNVKGRRLVFPPVPFHERRNFVVSPVEKHFLWPSSSLLYPPSFLFHINLSSLKTQRPFYKVQREKERKPRKGFFVGRSCPENIYSNGPHLPLKTRKHLLRQQFQRNLFPRATNRQVFFEKQFSRQRNLKCRPVVQLKCSMIAPFWILFLLPLSSTRLPADWKFKMTPKHAIWSSYCTLRSISRFHLV